MTEPTTVNKIFTVPATGDLVGAWATSALNPNFTAIDGILGGLVTISATTSVTLTNPSGTASPGAGPFQSQNALIRFSGTLTGNMSVIFTLPGYYIIENLCAGNATNYIQLSPSNGTGNNIGAPPGQKQHIFFDGTSMDYVNMPPVGTYLDLAVSTSPLWMTACTVSPWLACLGQAFSTTTYSNLNNFISNTFGGSGSAPLLPDMQSRSRISLDQTGVGRVTTAGSGLNGTTWGAAGGSQFLYTHGHAISDPGHVHNLFAAEGSVNGNTQIAPVVGGGATGGLVQSAVTGISIVVTGSGNSQNMPPALVAGITFIKT
jgi:microcystin-dependent protein